jgi:hypothetical protein
MNYSALHESGVLLSHAILLLDGSGTMKTEELTTKKSKHRAVAEMVQDLIGLLHDDIEIRDTLLTVISYDGNRVNDVRLSCYDVKQSKQYYRKPRDRDPRYDASDIDRWDPLVGHGGTTPIGRALAFGRQRAEEWVLSAARGVEHRAVICLLSDGMNYPPTEPDGMTDRQAIIEFNRAQREQLDRGGEYKGRVRLASVGYYQYRENHTWPVTGSEYADNNKRLILQAALEEEAQGRKLLKSLAYPQAAYFESNEAHTIARFLFQSLVM